MDTKTIKHLLFGYVAQEETKPYVHCTYTCTCTYTCALYSIHVHVHIHVHVGIQTSRAFRRGRNRSCEAHCFKFRLSEVASGELWDPRGL